MLSMNYPFYEYSSKNKFLAPPPPPLALGQAAPASSGSSGSNSSAPTANVPSYVTYYPNGTQMAPTASSQQNGYLNATTAAAPNSQSLFSNAQYMQFQQQYSPDASQQLLPQQQQQQQQQQYLYQQQQERLLQQQHHQNQQQQQQQQQQHQQYQQPASPFPQPNNPNLAQTAPLPEQNTTGALITPLGPPSGQYIHFQTLPFQYSNGANNSSNRGSFPQPLYDRYYQQAQPVQQQQQQQQQQAPPQQQPQQQQQQTLTLALLALSNGATALPLSYHIESPSEATKRYASAYDGTYQSGEHQQSHTYPPTRTGSNDLLNSMNGFQEALTGNGKPRPISSAPPNIDYSSIVRYSNADSLKRKRRSKLKSQEKFNMINSENAGDSSALSESGEIHKCKICDKVFPRPYNLKSHMKTHSTDKPFKCSVCNKEFARSHDKKRHELLHGGLKKFKCGGSLRDGVTKWGCGKRFARSDALSRHFRTETGWLCIKPLMDEAKRMDAIKNGSLTWNPKTTQMPEVVSAINAATQEVGAANGELPGIGMNSMSFQGHE